MNVVKSVVAAVWPIIYKVLESAANKTNTQLDDIAVEAANAAVLEWLADQTPNEQNFE